MIMNAHGLTPILVNRVCFLFSPLQSLPTAAGRIHKNARRMTVSGEIGCRSSRSLRDLIAAALVNVFGVKANETCCGLHLR